MLTFFQWRYTGNRFAVIVKDVAMDSKYVFNAYKVYHFAYRQVLHPYKFKLDVFHFKSSRV